MVETCSMCMVETLGTCSSPIVDECHPLTGLGKVTNGDRYGKLWFNNIRRPQVAYLLFVLFGKYFPTVDLGCFACKDVLHYSVFQMLFLFP